MKKTTRLAPRIDEQTKNEFEKVATARGMSASRAVREAMDLWSNLDDRILTWARRQAASSEEEGYPFHYPIRHVLLEHLAGLEARHRVWGDTGWAGVLIGCLRKQAEPQDKERLVPVLMGEALYQFRLEGKTNVEELRKLKLLESDLDEGRHGNLTFEEAEWLRQRKAEAENDD